MNWHKSIAVLLLIVSSAFWLMCAASKPGTERAAKKEEKKKVDQLLDTKKKKNEPGKNEDELLKLLGVETKKEEAKQPPERKTMETQVGDLEFKLKEKDSEISKLKTELEESNARLKNLENVLNDLKASSRTKPRTTVAPAPTSISFAEYKRRYEAARSEYLRRNYNSAIHAFEELLNIDATNSLSDNCRYWIGESYYGLEMYQRALTEFEKVFAFVNSNKEDAAQLKIGLCYKNLKQRDNARAAFQRLIIKYPKSEYVALAKKYLSEL